MKRTWKTIAASFLALILLLSLAACGKTESAASSEQAAAPETVLPTEGPTAEPTAEAPEPTTEAPESTEAPTDPSTEPVTEAPTEEPTTEASETELPETEVPTEAEQLSEEAAAQVAALRDWLGQPMSVDMEMYYDYFPLYGYDFSIRQLTGEDESFRFTQITSTFPSQAYADGDEDAPWEDTEVEDWYYGWEDQVFVCYDPDGNRSVLSKKTRREILEDASRVFGEAAVLPEELTDFRDGGTDETTGNRVFDYQIPVSVLLEAGTMPAWHINTAVSWSGGMTTLQPLEELEQADPPVYIRLEAAPDTLRPIRVSFDFSEVKPYLFGNGPMSAEYAMDVNVLYITIDYSFTLPATVERDTPLEDGFLETP